MRLVGFLCALVVVLTALLFTTEAGSDLRKGIHFRFGTAPAQSEEMLVLVDLSKSVKTEARTKAFSVTQGMGSHLKPGDTLGLGLISGNSSEEWPDPVKMGEPLPYDQQRRRFEEQIKGEIEALQAPVAAPYDRTDILGALERAGSKLQPLSRDAKPDRCHVIAVLSDLIQDDGRRYDFKSDKRLGDAGRAKGFADQLAERTPDLLRGVYLYLGCLGSRDREAMSPERKRAIRNFWEEFGRSSGAVEVIWREDGPGDFSEFVASLPRK